ncbi:MAG: hypothetical protein K6F23_10555 [Solobacterium sp.]|nr:hypothetical protein [Solobacterium sp.]
MPNKVYVELGSKNTITAAPLYQFDYGMEIVLTGTVPDNVRAEIAAEGSDAETVAIVQNTISIPDNLLMTGKDIHCYIVRYISQNERTTLYQIIIPVRTRPNIT